MVSIPARRVRRCLVLALTVLGVAAGMAAASEAPSPYAGQDTRAIKALAPEAVEGYLAGRGMELAKAAELNGYPGPRHLLDLADRLHLTPEQRTAIKAAHAAMAQNAQRLGRAIVAAETELDRVFASGKAQGQDVDRLTGRIGALHGELRAVHLKAHLAVRGLLNDSLVAHYNTLRGYGGGMEPNRHRH